MDGDLKKQAGVQSVEIAAEVLRAILADGGATTLTRIAEQTAMPAAKIHRYLVSLVRAGLVEQDSASPRYRIGAFSMELGLAALGSIDTVEIGTHAMRSLRDRLNQTTVLTFWGSHGPTIVRFMESSHPVTVNVRVGNVLPLLTTALGRIYYSYLQTDPVRAIAETERRRLGIGKKDLKELAETTRRRGLARVEGDLLPGVSALAAAVLDYRGELAAAIGVIGRTADFDGDWTGAIATDLTAAAQDLSHSLGYSPADKRP
tara:strand:- start:14738 stop:15517 length:780 start_codon:yes stop_codon:yes gene_type:complete